MDLNFYNHSDSKVYDGVASFMDWPIFVSQPTTNHQTSAARQATDWEGHKLSIEALYLHQDLALKDTILRMKQDRGFKATYDHQIQ